MSKRRVRFGSRGVGGLNQVPETASNWDTVLGLRVGGFALDSLAPGPSLVEEFKVDLFEVWVAMELLNELFLAAVATPEVAPLAVLLGARNVKLPIDVFAELAADGARHSFDGLDTPIGLLASEADPSSITHTRSDDSRLKLCDGSREAR